MIEKPANYVMLSLWFEFMRAHSLLSGKYNGDQVTRDTIDEYLDGMRTRWNILWYLNIHLINASQSRGYARICYSNGNIGYIYKRQDYCLHRGILSDSFSGNLLPERS